MAQLKLSLDAIRFSTRKPVLMADVANTDIERRYAAALESDGFRHCLRDERDIIEMAAEAMRATLRNVGVEPRQVDAVIFSTESFWDADVRQVAHRAMPDHTRIRDGFIAATAEMGLHRAYPYGCWMSACGNLGPVLALGHDLIMSGRHETALVVIVDRQLEGGSRFLNSGNAVVSDLAASCLLGTKGGGVHVLGVTGWAATNLMQYQGGGDYLRLSLETKRALREFARHLERTAPFALPAADMVLFDHFHRSLIELFCDAMRLDYERIGNNVDKSAGHAHAIDLLVQLEDLRAAGRLAPGAKIVLFNIGVCTWTVIHLEIAATVS
jgi:3-oxoacyl-[acyl-carrier-protein] synthase-3